VCEQGGNGKLLTRQIEGGNAAARMNTNPAITAQKSLLKEFLENAMLEQSVLEIIAEITIAILTR